MKVPILTYHSAQIDGNTYETNDHHALAGDVRMLAEEGFRVVPLSWVVEWIKGERPSQDLERAVAITFDDGCSLDYWDLVHPTWGEQRSFAGVLRDAVAEIGAERQPTMHATTFVIASPQARAQIAELLAGPEWLSDAWWEEATREGLLGIENHSWDHNHPAVRPVCQRDQESGRFDNIVTLDECNAEIAAASDYIREKTGVPPRYFAYPWGQASRYLLDEYLPNESGRHGCQAAFSAHDGLAAADSPLWAIPRVVFRANWTTPDGFREILRESVA